MRSFPSHATMARRRADSDGFRLNEDGLAWIRSVRRDPDTGEIEAERVHGFGAPEDDETARRWRRAADGIEAILDLPWLMHDVSRLKSARDPTMPIEHRKMMRKLERNQFLYYGLLVPAPMLRSFADWSEVWWPDLLERSVKRMRAFADALEGEARAARHASGKSPFETDGEAWRAHGLARGLMALVHRHAAEHGREGLARWFEFPDARDRTAFDSGLKAAMARHRSGSAKARSVVCWLLTAGCLPDAMAPLQDAWHLDLLLRRVERGKCCVVCGRSMVPMNKPQAQGRRGRRGAGGSPTRADVHIRSEMKALEELERRLTAERKAGTGFKAPPPR